jgi:hypothetical protein
MVMDGWGIAAPGPGNAIDLASAPIFDRLRGYRAQATVSASLGRYTDPRWIHVVARSGPIRRAGRSLSVTPPDPLDVPTLLALVTGMPIDQDPNELLGAATDRLPAPSRVVCLTFWAEVVAYLDRAGSCSPMATSRSGF